MKTKGYKSLEDAIQATMIPPIDCLMVGDRAEDCLAAVNAGIPFMWAHEWREE